MGTQRAGVLPSSPLFAALITALLPLLADGSCTLAGLYSHAGHSYAGADTATAISTLNDELSALLAATDALRALAPAAASTPITLSVGATPTTTAASNLLHPSAAPSAAETTALTALRATIAAIHTASATIELHAGVYTLLDLQQLATHARPPAQLSEADLGLTVLAEVASVYPERRNGEALITAGSVALGREPCKSYAGWGVVTPWGGGREGWIVGSVSQEHGVLRWTGPGRGEGLEVGSRVRVWPNHACIAGTGFDWYLVVDSRGDNDDKEGKEVGTGKSVEKGDVIVDVWVRWRGW